MEQHKQDEQTPSIKFSMFIGGAMVAVSVCEFIYRSPMGFVEERSMGRLLVFGLVFMSAPIWAYLRKKSSDSE